MKNYKLPVLGMGIVLLVASCRKEDVQRTEAVTVPAASASQWKSIPAWSNSKAEDVTTYFSATSDSAITTQVANAGLVLVYKKSGSDIQSLPFQEKDGKTYWYYQVSKGTLRINSDHHNGQNLAQQSFAYFVITPEQLSKLEASGKTKFDLLQLSFEQAAALTK